MAHIGIVKAIDRQNVRQQRGIFLGPVGKLREIVVGIAQGLDIRKACEPVGKLAERTELGEGCRMAERDPLGQLRLDQRVLFAVVLPAAALRHFGQRELLRRDAVLAAQQLFEAGVGFDIVDPDGEIVLFGPVE